MKLIQKSLFLTIVPFLQENDKLQKPWNHKSQRGNRKVVMCEHVDRFMRQPTGPHKEESSDLDELASVFESTPKIKIKRLGFFYIWPGVFSTLIWIFGLWKNGFLNFFTFFSCFCIPDPNGISNHNLTFLTFGVGKGTLTIFYGWRILTSVVLACRREKNKK